MKSVLVVACLSGVACSSTLQSLNTDAGIPASSCQACVTSMDCNTSETCVQLEDETCLRTCISDSECASTDQCVILTTYNGQNVGACAARTGVCSELPPGTITDAGVTANTGPTPDGYCGSLAGPQVDNTNCSCSGSGCTANNCTNGWYCDTSQGRCVLPPNASSCESTSGVDAGNGYCGVYAGPMVSGTKCTCEKAGQCAANNCYGGYYCDTSDNKCVAAPSDCTTTVPDAGTSVPDAGPVVVLGDGGIDPTTGGTAEGLEFVVAGDTRPANDNDTSGYPTQIANGIYADIAALSPAPLFVIGTGDYQFADPGSGNNQPQLALYQQARSQWKGIFWPAMGNHECTGATASNCGSGNSDGVTSNFTDFQSDFLTPIGQTLPYYTRVIKATDGSWSAKFIFAASNYWDSTQESWYQQQLQMSSTYTFVIDHEYEGSGSPGDESIFSDAQGSAVTLHIVGHTHTWEQKSSTLIVGNGGAPVTGGAPYGYTIFQRRTSDGAIVITGYDYTTKQPASGEQFCISASGGSVSTCP